MSLAQLTRTVLPLAMLALTVPVYGADPLPSPPGPSATASLTAASCLVLNPAPATQPLAAMYLLQPCETPATLKSKAASTIHPTVVPETDTPLCAVPLEPEALTLGIEAVKQGLNLLPIDTVEEAFSTIVEEFATTRPKTTTGK